MAVNRISIKQEDKYITVIYPYYTALQAKGSVVILHGMAEHHERYKDYARFLNENGYDAFLYDHRGHGLDKKFEDIGYIADTDGYKKLICDAIAVLKYVKGANRGAKLVLFGHSMGSLIARNVIQYYDAVDCCILSGTTYPSMSKTRAGLLISSLIKLFKGGHHLSPYMKKMTVGTKKYTQISTRTANDWLTRDNNIVGAYINDPYCGFICTISFYRDLLKLVKYSSMIKMIRRTRRTLPILLVSGSVDPVGDYSREVVNLFSVLQKCGFENVDCTIYEECRHELLNEINNEEIMKDILNWMEDIYVSDDDTDTHDTELHLRESKENVMDEEAVLEQVRTALTQKEQPETEGEKKLADMRAKKLARQKGKQKNTDKSNKTSRTAIDEAKNIL